MKLQRQHPASLWMAAAMGRRSRKRCRRPGGATTRCSPMPRAAWPAWIWSTCSASSTTCPRWRERLLRIVHCHTLPRLTCPSPGRVRWHLPTGRSFQRKPLMFHVQNSAHFRNEQRKQAQAEERIARLKRQAAALTQGQLAGHQRCAWSLPHPSTIATTLHRQLSSQVSSHVR
jgi:hypothetical protein